MKVDAKSISRKVSVTDYCGSLTFKATNKIDTVMLAALYRAWTRRDEEGSARIRQFQKESLERYCRKRNVTITMRERE